MRARVKRMQTMVAQMIVSAAPGVPVQVLAVLAEMSGLLAELSARFEKLDAEAVRLVETVDTGLGVTDLAPVAPTASPSEGKS